ncbi:MAG: hypothetical protein AB2A00_10725 [Myxococcota bacterium]
MEVLEREPGFAVAAWRNMFVIFFADAVTVSRLQRVWDREKEWVQRAGPVAVVSISRKAAKMLTLPAEERALAARIAKDMDASMLCQAHVIMGTGFWAATVRTVISSVQLMSSPRYPVSVFDDVPSAATWVTPRLDKGVDAHEVQRIVQAVVDLEAGGARAA